MSMVAALAAALAVLLAPPVRAGLRLRADHARLPRAARDGAVPQGRLLLVALCGVGGYLFVGGPAAPIAAAAATGAAWWFLARAEPPAERRVRRQVRADLPHLVDLLAAALRSGAAPGEAVRLACGALPGPAADRLSGVTERLGLGIDPERVWESLARDADLAPLGRALARSTRTGAAVVATVEQLSDELRQAARGQVEERARAVGVRAALPLGLCLLPSFLLLGIVPLVVGLLSQLAL